MGRSLEWNWLALASCLFLFPFTFGLYFIPESPPWLIYNDEEDLAYKSMVVIRGEEYDASIEINRIKDRSERKKRTSKSGLCKCYGILTFNIPKRLKVCIDILTHVEVKFVKAKTEIIGNLLVSTDPLESIDWESRHFFVDKVSITEDIMYPLWSQ